MKKEESKIESSQIRNAVEWIVILAIPLVLYLTGWHTEVTGRLQQAVLWTGLIQPEINLDNKRKRGIDYNMPLISLDGERTNLTEHKGKVIFLNFWATWCPPCIAEMPNIQALYEKFETNDHIVFVMVSLDENPAEAREFIARKEFTFPVYQLNGSRPAGIQSPTIPTTYVIDKQGALAVEKQGMANYDTISFYSFLKNLSKN